ncbi:MAG TPA: NUDIX hydrolase [Anaerolineales bacterium]|nr:NUDIX hydrolase [Anaerolineales bacterium]
MIRAQCIVQRGNCLLMVKHHWQADEWWCLPGGGMQPGESPTQAALRELQEECGVIGQIVRQTGHTLDADGMETNTFLVDIGDQQPKRGIDPELSPADQILVDMRWLSLSEIPERDRAYLWAAGLMSVPVFLNEVSQWGDDISYPIE